MALSLGAWTVSVDRNLRYFHGCSGFPSNPGPGLGGSRVLYKAAIRRLIPLREILATLEFIKRQIPAGTFSSFALVCLLDDQKCS